MRVHELKPPFGANVTRKRVGRGESSGLGKTAGKGGKGQTARTGKGKPRRGFEGGQTPMYRRMPKRGFRNIFALKWAEVNLDLLARYFPAGREVTVAGLQEAGLAPRNVDGLRVLGRGDMPHALTITANHFSASAKQKIEAAGGKVVVIEPVKKPEASA